MNTRLLTSSWAPERSMEKAALNAICATSNQLVAAGPGAGKTELLAERAAFLLQTPTVLAPERRILAVSFKREAAHTLRTRIEKRVGSEAAKRLETYTFAAWAKGLVDRLRLGLPAAYCPTADYLTDRDFNKQNSKCDNLRDWMKASASAAQVAEQIGRAESWKLTKFYLNDIIGKPISKYLPEGASAVLSRACWHHALHVLQPSRLTFGMIECLADLLLRTNPKLVAALRQTYGAVFLDEFQDTTASQYHLLYTAFGTSDALVTAVGDRKQLIMGWAGADEKVFEWYQRDFGVPAPVPLCYNYRSAQELVAIQAYLAQHLVPASPAIEGRYQLASASSWAWLIN